MFMRSGGHSLRLGEEDKDEASGILGEVEAGGWSRAEGPGGAGRSMARAVEDGASGDCSSKEFATVRERRGDEIMNRRVCTSMVFSGIFMLSAGLAKAQEAAPPPSEAVVIHGGEPGGDVMFAPFSGPIGFLGFSAMPRRTVAHPTPFCP